MGFKITISTNLYNRLISDKNDSDFKSENDFFSTIILNTYDYQSKTKRIQTIKNALYNPISALNDNAIIKAIHSVENDTTFEKQFNEVARTINSALYNSKKFNDDSNRTIYIRDTKKTKGMLNGIAMNELYAMHSSTFFRNILEDYINYPLYIRQRIICNDIYNKIDEIKTRKMKCFLVSKKGNKYSLDLYDIGIDKEEFNYYVYGITTYESKGIQKREIRCFKLSTISLLIETDIPIEITDEEKNQIKDRLKYDVTWIGGEHIKDCKVEFDEEGNRLYKILYKDRPIGIRDLENPNVYIFSCNKTQLSNYLKLFGGHAVVLNNNELKNELKKFYEDANNKYK